MATPSATTPRKRELSDDDLLEGAAAEDEMSEDDIFQAAEDASDEEAPIAAPEEFVPEPGQRYYEPFTPEEAASVNPAWDGKTVRPGLPPLPTPKPPEEEGFIGRFLRNKAEELRARTAGALSYGSSGFADEAFGLTRMPTDLRRRIENDLPLPKDKGEALDMYRSLRDNYRTAEDAIREERPGDFHVAGVATSMLLPTPKIAGPLGPVVTGATQGYLSGLGGTKAELLDPTLADAAQLKLDTDWSTGVGAAFGAAGQAVGNALEWAGAKYGPAVKTWLARKAEEKALKSVTGRNLPLWQSLLSKDPSLVNEIGRDLLDEGALDKSKVMGGRELSFWDRILPGLSTEEVRKRAGEIAAREGKNIDDALKEVDALIPEDQRWWKYDIAKEIEDYLVRPRKAMTAGDESIAKRLQAEADKIRQHSFENRPTLMQMEQQKRALDKFIDHDTPAMKPMSDALDDLRDRINFNIEQKGWAAAEAAGSDAAQRFQESKRLFGNMATIADPASKQAARELTNRTFSASDYGLGGVAAMSSAAEGASPVASSLRGAAAALFNKIARERGNQALASGMDAASQSDWLENIIQVRPGALGPYAKPLTDALARGGRGAMAIQDFILGNTDEQYRDLRRRLPSLTTGEPARE